MAQTAGQQEQKVLMTARNGMQVWVPLSRLPAWKAAQADNSPEARQENRMLAERLLSRLTQLSQGAPET